MLFEFQDYLEWEHIYRYADAIGLDLERFDDDVRVHPSKALHRVQDDAQDAELMDLNSTPTFFVDGLRHKGPWDAASLIRALATPPELNSIASHELSGGTASLRHRSLESSPGCIAVS